MKQHTEGIKVGQDFTQGPILKQMIGFGVPILCSSFLQQLYNSVDTMVIGRCGGTVGAVGVSNGGEVAAVITFIALAFGNAAQIYISQLRGAKDEEGIRDSIGTSISFTLLLSLVLAALCIIFCNPVLKMLNTQEVAMSEAMSYMIIVSLGLPAVFGYNSICGILRGMGESAKPLIFIVIATITNVFLDILLVAVIPLGAAGTAIATIVAEYASFAASLVFLYMKREDFGIAFHLKSFAIQRKPLHTLLRLGIPLTLQSALVHVTQVYCNSQVNEYGLVASAANSIGLRIYRLMHVGATSISASTAAMIGQNLGAKNHERAKKVVYVSLACCAVLGTFEVAASLFLPRQIFSIFIQAPEVIEFGIVYMQIMAIACFLCIFQTPYQAMVTGSGNAKLGLFTGIFDGVIVRLSISLPLSAMIGVTGFFYGNHLSHLAPVIISMIYFYSGKWKNYKI